VQYREHLQVYYRVVIGWLSLVYSSWEWGRSTVWSPGKYSKRKRGCHGRDRMIVGFTITYAIGAYHH
jgi:hypothetical protein